MAASAHSSRKGPVGHPQLAERRDVAVDQPQEPVKARRHAKAMAWLQNVYQYKPDLFAHWQLIAFTASRTVGPDDGDRHVRS